MFRGRLKPLRDECIGLKLTTWRTFEDPVNLLVVRYCPQSREFQCCPNTVAEESCE
jgi:hypothetical protein